MFRIKLKGGALYVSVIIAILTSIILSLFLFIAHFNTRTIQSQKSLEQLRLSLVSGFEIAQSIYFQDNKANHWQKMPYNNDSVRIKKMPWGCYTLIDVSAKNNHFFIQGTGLYGVKITKDTALFMTERNRPIGLAGKIKFNGFCYLPKAGIKSAYIEGSTFSDLNSLKPFIKEASSDLPIITESYLKELSKIQNELSPHTDSLVSFVPDILDNSFHHKTVVIQSGSVVLNTQTLKNNIKIIASNLITIENNCQLENVLLIAKKIVFKKGFKGTVHVIAKDSIISENGCEFDYPSSFCVYNDNPLSNPKTTYQPIRGIFFGEACKFNGALLAVNDNNKQSKMIIKLNKHFELTGTLYSSDYASLQGNMYGSIFCQNLLLQTPSAVYENHLLDCLIDSKKYSNELVVPNWFSNNKQKLNFAKKL